VYPHNAADTLPFIVLYGHVGTSGFHAVFTKLKALADDRRIAFTYRYKPPTTKEDKMLMAGYGVQVAIKSTEYMVVDDTKASTLVKDSDDKSDNIEQSDVIKALQETAQGKKLKPESLNGISPVNVLTQLDIGLLATSFIVASKQPLTRFRQLVQDFPRYAHLLLEQDLDPSISEKVSALQSRGVHAEHNLMWINGLSFDTKDPNVFRLLRLLKQELATMNTLMAHGLSADEARKLLLATQAEDSNSSGDLFEDMYDLLSDNDSIMWLNDIEHDAKFAKLSDNIFAACCLFEHSIV
jgi:UDP-glucose:glycoprotein glucosyltransferase